MNCIIFEKFCTLQAGADKIFAPGALELLSAKVAGTSGDIRRALDLGKRVIEVVEQNQIPVSGNINTFLFCLNKELLKVNIKISF